VLLDRRLVLGAQTRKLSPIVASPSFGFLTRRHLKSVLSFERNSGVAGPLLVILLFAHAGARLDARGGAMTRLELFDSAAALSLGVELEPQLASWDIRPKSEPGTIEPRVCDTPLTVERAASIACYLQALCRWLLVERPFEPAEDDYLACRFNRFPACRFRSHHAHSTPPKIWRKPAGWMPAGARLAM